MFDRLLFGFGFLLGLAFILGVGAFLGHAFGGQSGLPWGMGIAGTISLVAMVQIVFDRPR